MGALHQGHYSLMDLARPQASRLVVSIFVNPMQFNQTSDLDAYPRTWEADLAGCARHGVDVIYYPSAQAMYPDGFQSKVEVTRVSQGLEGEFRPGHFAGVATVVLKLFNAVCPDLAIFGQKDYQQLMVIQAMTRDLDLPIEIIGAPTVREADGLAMSSRNARLSPRERSEALCLWRGLSQARELAQAGETKAEVLLAAARAQIEAVPGARLEYLVVADAHTLEPVDQIQGPARLLVAAWLGQTRLIDNLPLND